jgi:MFS family permease
MPPQSPRLNEREGTLQESLREPLLVRERSDATDTPPHRKPSRNVNLTLLYTALAFAGRSIWSQNVLAAYVFLLKDNNPEAVGFITATMGITQLIASFPAGYIADKYRRDRLLKVSAFVGTCAVLATILASLYENYKYLVAALAVWGFFWGIANTALSALFADSIASGDRSYYFTQRSILITVGNTFGPLFALVMFAILGDHWTIRDCAIVMALGQCVCFPAIVLLCFFSDDHCVEEGDSSDDATDDIDDCQQLIAGDDESVCADQEDQGLDTPSTTSSDDSRNDDEEADFDGNQSEQELAPSSGSLLMGCIPRTRIIPVLLASGDLMSGLASGMSIRYFSIFFVNNLRLNPVLVQVIYILAPILQAMLMKISQLLAVRFGRLHVAVTHKYIGISFMFLMIGAHMAKFPTWVVCLVYVIRTAFMNSTSALTRSMLMDHVPKQERGKWSALESVNMFSWSGSAALGGVLVGLIGILPLFAITAMLQFVATLPMVALFPHDQNEQSHQSNTNISNTPRQQQGEFDAQTITSSRSSTSSGSA